MVRNAGAKQWITLPTLCACLVLAFYPPYADGSVVIRTGNYTFDPIPSMPADFGPRIPEDGIQGELVIADPEDACAPLAPPEGGEGARWVALIARSQSKLEHCTFDVKVRNAEGAGAAAAIVYDDVSEGLIIMSKPYMNPEPRIPAVFVTQRSGVLMKKLLQAPGPTIVIITPLSGALWLSMLLSAFAACLAVFILLATLWMVRRQRGGVGADLPGAGHGPMHQAGMRAEQIRALPVVVHHCRQQEEAAQQAEQQQGAGAEAVGGAGSRGGSDDSSDDGRRGGGTRRSCAICLEAYGDGDKLRVLPCQHRYHTECIDQWLSSRRPLCPVCKADASRPDVEACAGGGTGSSLLSVAGSAIRGLMPDRWFGRARSPDGAAVAGEGSGVPAEASRLLPEGPGSPLRRQQSLPVAAAAQGESRGLESGSSEIVPDLEAGTAPPAIAPAVASPTGAVWGPGVGVQADSSTEESELDSGAE